MFRSCTVKILVEDFICAEVRVDTTVVSVPVDLSVLLLQDFGDVVGSFSCRYIGERDCLRLVL